MGLAVEWDAEIMDAKEGEYIVWRSLPGSTISNRGSVEFRPATNGSGTEVAVALTYHNPGGKVGAAFAKMFGREPEQQIREDLRRFKALDGSRRDSHRSGSIRRSPFFGGTRHAFGQGAGSHATRAQGPAAGHRGSTAAAATRSWRCAMKALCWYGKQDVRIETVPDPVILNPHDYIVKVTRTAICGSDLHLYDGYIPTMEQGDILGHEFMGEIVEVGPEVKKRQVGDRVVVPFTIPAAIASSASSSFGRSAITAILTRRLPRPCTVIRGRRYSATRTCTEVMPAARPSMCACPSLTSGRSRSKAT